VDHRRPSNGKPLEANVTGEVNGLIARGANPADSRAVQLDITDAGRAVAERAVARVHLLLEELTAPLGGVRSKRMATLVDSLETLLAAPSPQPPGGTNE
jgi:DNA-binding MarR family transcriptional regulator